MTNRVVNSYYGEIIISDQFKISRSTTKAQLIAFFGESNISVRDIENGYIHYTIRGVIIEKISFSFLIIFNHEQLHMIIFGFDYSPTDNWSNWSEEKELKRLDKYEKWLTQQIGTKRNYPWGVVEASFDRKGGSTSIVMRYLK